MLILYKRAKEKMFFNLIANLCWKNLLNMAHTFSLPYGGANNKNEKFYERSEAKQTERKGPRTVFDEKSQHRF